MVCSRRRFTPRARTAGVGALPRSRSARVARAASRLSVLALALTGMTAASTPASAATYALRPAKTVAGSGWTTTPQGATPDSLLAKAVTQPAVPDTSSFLTAPGSWWWNNLGVQVATPPTFATGESVSSATAWVYLTTAATQPLTVYLDSGLQELASTNVPSGKPAGWYSVSTQKALTPTDLGQLTIWLQVDGSTSSTYSEAYAAYVELDTTAPTPSVIPAPVTPSSTTPLPLAQTHLAQVPDVVSLVSQTVAVSPASSSIPITLTCPASTPGGCRGTLTLSLGPGPGPGPNAKSHGKSHGKAKASRCARGCRVLGHTNFQILAGRSKHVKVHLAHSASTLFHGHSSIQLEATTVTQDGNGKTQTSQTMLTVRRAGPAHHGSVHRRPAHHGPAHPRPKRHSPKAGKRH